MFFFQFLLFSLLCVIATSRGVWSSIPRKKTSSSASQTAVVDDLLSSDSADISQIPSFSTPKLSETLSNEAIHLILEELFAFFEDFLNSTEFNSNEIFSIIHSIQNDFTTSSSSSSSSKYDSINNNVKNPSSSPENGDDSSLQQNLNQPTTASIRKFLFSINEENLQLKLFELISIGRDYRDEITELITNPPQLLKFLETVITLTPEILPILQKLIINNNLKEYLLKNYEINEIEFHEHMKLFQEMYQEMILSSSEEEDLTAADLSIDFTQFFNFNQQDQPPSSSSPLLPLEGNEILTMETIEEFFQLFHDPNQVEKFRQLILQNPHLAKELLGVDESILARSEAFGEYMALFTAEMSSIMNPKQQKKKSKKEEIKNKNNKKKKSIFLDTFEQ